MRNVGAKANDLIAAFDRADTSRTLSVDKTISDVESKSALGATGQSIAHDTAPAPAQPKVLPVWDGQKTLESQNQKSTQDATQAQSQQQAAQKSASQPAPADQARAQAQALKEAVGQAYRASAQVMQSGFAQLKTGFGALLDAAGIPHKYATPDSKGLDKSGHPIGTTQGEAVHDPHEARSQKESTSQQQRPIVNVAERANISRFLQEPGDANHSKELADALRRMRESEAGDDFRNAAFARREAQRKEMIGEERREEMHKASPETKEQGTDQTRTRDKKNPEIDDEGFGFDDRNFVGGGAASEAHLDEAATEHHGIREMDVLNERARCKGALEDGNRCLRRAVDGTPYCREHALGFQMGAVSGPDGTPSVPETTLDEASPVEDLANAGVEKTLDDVPVFREEPKAAVREGGGTVVTD